MNESPNFDSDLPIAFWQGVEQFNAGEFYTCHDTLEALWMEAIEPDRTFYQGILQLAVGLYHLSNYNWRGAVILLGEGIGRLQSYRPDYGTVDLDQLIDQSQTLLKALQTSGDEAMAEGRSKTLEPYVQLLRETTQEVPEAVSRELSVPKIKRQPSKCQARM